MSASEAKKSSRKIPTKAQYLNYCSLSDDEIHKLVNGTDADRDEAKVSATEARKEEILAQQEMSTLEEILTVLFLACGVPTGVFNIPIITFFVGKFVIGSVQTAFIVLAALLLPLALLPQPYTPTVLHSWIAIRVVKYFSFRFIHEKKPKKKDLSNPEYRTQILVAPPHGVFPYGNLLSMLIYPAVCGGSFRGLAASSALRPPIFKQILRSMGVIDASRHVARKALEDGETLGISTGGVAEVFETNADDECIVLKQRIGLIKLAIRTGSDLVPCYLFGNTDLLGCWAGEGIPQGRNILEKISRKIGFALVMIYGRFGLPIPRRVPILGVMGEPIPTHHMKCEEPTEKQIELIQMQLFEGMEDIFECYKGLYGWDTKKLIIK